MIGTDKMANVVRILLEDTGSIIDYEVTETEVPARFAAAARRGIGPVPRIPVIKIQGYEITQPETTPTEYDYVAVRRSF